MSVAARRTEERAAALAAVSRLSSKMAARRFSPSLTPNPAAASFVAGRMAEDAGANAAMGEAIAASKTQAIIRLAAVAFVYENYHLRYLDVFDSLRSETVQEYLL